MRTPSDRTAFVGIVARHSNWRTRAGSYDLMLRTRGVAWLVRDPPRGGETGSGNFAQQSGRIPARRECGFRFDAEYLRRGVGEDSAVKPIPS